MRIEQSELGFAIVDGWPPAVARWQLVEGRVLLSSSSGRTYDVDAVDTPLEIAVGLLGLRDAGRFVMEGAGEEAGAYALRAWLGVREERLVAGRGCAEERASLWAVYRFAFMARVGGRG